LGAIAKLVANDAYRTDIVVKGFAKALMLASTASAVVDEPFSVTGMDPWIRGFYPGVPLLPWSISIVRI
jgi:hypothetical protein